MTEYARQPENQDRPLLKEKAAEKSSIFKRMVKKARSFMLASMMAIAPSIGCGDARDTSMDKTTIVQDDQNNDAQTGAKMESKELRENVGTLYNDGVDWYFDGNYQDNFNLVATANGKVVLDEMVMPAEDHSFALNKPFLEEYGSRIDIKTFHIDQDGNKGSEIVIDGNPPHDGMYGVPYTTRF